MDTPLHGRICQCLLVFLHVFMCLHVMCLHAFVPTCACAYCMCIYLLMSACALPDCIFISRTCMYLHVLVPACVCVFVSACVCMCTHVYVCVRMSMYVYACACVCVCMCFCLHVYTCVFSIFYCKHTTLLLDRQLLEKVLLYADEYQVVSARLHVDSTIAMKIYAYPDKNGFLQVNVPESTPPSFSFCSPAKRTAFEVAVQSSFVPSSSIPRSSSASSRTTLALKDLHLCDTYDLKESKRLIIAFLVCDNSSTTYKGTVFNQLSSESKYEILQGKVRRFLRGAAIQAGTITVCDTNNASDQFELIQNISSL